MTTNLRTGETKFAETYDEFLRYKRELSVLPDLRRARPGDDRAADGGAAATGRRCGVLGDPIAHSLSPALHRAGYAALGLDWRYDPERVAEDGLADFLGGLRRVVAGPVPDHAAEARPRWRWPAR